MIITERREEERDGMEGGWEDGLVSASFRRRETERMYRALVCREFNRNMLRSNGIIF